MDQKLCSNYPSSRQPRQGHKPVLVSPVMDAQAAAEKHMAALQTPSAAAYVFGGEKQSIGGEASGGVRAWAGHTGTGAVRG